MPDIELTRDSIELGVRFAKGLRALLDKVDHLTAENADLHRRARALYAENADLLRRLSHYTDDRPRSWIDKDGPTP